MVSSADFDDDGSIRVRLDFKLRRIRTKSRERAEPRRTRRIIVIPASDFAKRVC
jgi:hypothetical protein